MHRTTGVLGAEAAARAQKEIPATGELLRFGLRYWEDSPTGQENSEIPGDSSEVAKRVDRLSISVANHNW